MTHGTVFVGTVVSVEILEFGVFEAGVIEDESASLALDEIDAERFLFQMHSARKGATRACARGSGFPLQITHLTLQSVELTVFRM